MPLCKVHNLHENRPGNWIEYVPHRRLTFNCCNLYKSMNILYLTTGFYEKRGIESVLSHKANYFAKILGYNVTIITTEQKHRPLCFLLDDKIKILDFGLNYEDDFYLNPLVKAYNHYKKNFIYKKKLNDFLIKNPQDICISLCGKDMEFLPSINDGSKKVLELHFSKRYVGHFLLEHHKGFIWHIIAKLKDLNFVRMARNFDEMVVLTKKDQEDWKKSINSVIQIYNSIPSVEVEPSICENKHFMAAGGFTFEKGFDRLIEVWNIVVKKHPDWHIDLWGCGILEDELKKMVSQKGLEMNIHFKGVTNDIYGELRKSSGFLMTSRREGFPRVLLESLRCGIPIVSYDIDCGPNEIIIDGKNGFLVPDGDSNQCAERICILIENDDLRKRMGKSAYLQSESFNETLIMQQWQIFFDDILKQA